jgi:hypothetical protein
MTNPDALLAAAERIAARLAGRGIHAVLIGASALAAHRYVRHTEDIDLGVNVAICDLGSVAEGLREAGYDVSVREPDGQDPLGGVIDISGPFGLVQIVNFGERFPAVIDSGHAEATLCVRLGAGLRVIPLPHLIALKLYAGGMKSKADIVEVLKRNPDADRGAIRALCRQYRLRGLEPLIREADGDATAARRAMQEWLDRREADATAVKVRVLSGRGPTEEPHGE